MRIIGPVAGVGSRLRPFTSKKPKAFMKIAGKSVLVHILDKLRDNFEKGTELILIVGYKKEQIMEYIDKYYSDYFNIVYLEQVPRGYEGDMPYFWGLGEAVYLGNERFDFKKTEGIDEKEEGCLIFLGDMILLDEYSYILEKFNRPEVDGLITVMRVPKEEASSYGIVTTDDDMFIKSLVEKPKEFIGDLAIAGIYMFNRRATEALFSNLKKYLDMRTPESGEVYMTQSLQDLIDQNFKILVVELKKGILDFGRASELLKSNQYLLDHLAENNKSYSCDTQKFKNCVINDPVFIEEGTNITNSVIGPYVSIGKNCSLNRCIVKNTVIENNSLLTNIITEESIIGSQVNIENLSKDNLMIGDKSQLIYSNDKY